jgi:hypothetical protein
LNYQGPYRVTNQIDDTKYEIENLINEEIFTVHIKELRPFYHDPSTIDPKEIARHAIGEFFVDSFIDIKGDRNPKTNRFFKTNLFFKVRWEGYDESYDTWEPYKELKLTEKFHTHCKLNNLKYLIPKNLETNPSATDNPI